MDNVGEIQPLPAQVYPRGEAVVAIRELAAARHIGKVVLQAAPCLPPPEKPSLAGRWVITGGTGALGSLAGSLTSLLQRSVQCSGFISTFIHFQIPVEEP